MTEVAEFQPITHRRRIGRWPVEGGSYSEPRLPEVDSLLGRARCASSRLNTPNILPIQDEIAQSQPISPVAGLLAEVDRFVYGLLDAPANSGPAIEVEMPLDDWFWCGDPAMTPRICLKKRISILTRFDG
jgi:hypothetical protein